MSSTQDASGPSAPGLWSLSRYLGRGIVTLTWAPAIDHGVGISHYEVYHYREGLGIPVISSFEVIGQSYTFINLEEGVWQFGVRAVDAFGYVGPWAEVNTTMDRSSPTRPVLDELPTFSHGTRVTLRWNRPTDGSGIDYYRVFWRQTANYATIRYVDLIDNEATITDLTEEVLYWFWVVAYDYVGNRAESNKVSSTLDASPPPAPAFDSLPPVVGSDSLTLAWSDEPDGSGQPVEFQVMRWFPLDMEIEHPVVVPWTYETSAVISNLSDGGTYTYYVLARDHLGWVSMSELVSVTVDLTPPVVIITSPSDGETVPGVVAIGGMLEDPHLDSYQIQYLPSGTTAWSNIVVPTPAGGAGYFLDTWVASSLPDGRYMIEVIAMDALGHVGADSVEVVLYKGAELTMSPLDIAFSNSRPHRGETVIAMVALHNHGDSHARNITFVVYDNGIEVLNRFPVTIGAHGYYVIRYEFKVNGTHEITARAFSDLYDTGEIQHGAVLEPANKEQEGFLEDHGGVLGMLGVLLALVGLMLLIPLGSAALRKERLEEVYEED